MSCQDNIESIISQVVICNPMSNRGRNHIICTLNYDSELSIRPHMNDLHLIADHVCTKIDVLLDLINVRDGNISCGGFTGEEINFMIYDICVN